MASGVYLLNFSGNAYYIGKSNDIERRWKEHTLKFQKGTAAKAMQLAYDRWGMPKFSIHVECHEDHIDLIESISIAHNRNILINTTQPKELYVQDITTLLSNKGLLQLSTAEHIRLIETNEANLKIQADKSKQALYKKEAECYRANKEVVAGLQDSLKELTFNFDELEIAYDALLNRDEFIVDLLHASSTKEVLIKRLRQENLKLEGHISDSYETCRKLKSRTLWERICNK